MLARIIGTDDFPVKNGVGFFNVASWEFMGDEKLREALKVAIIASNPGSVHDANRNEELKKCTKCNCDNCVRQRSDALKVMKTMKRKIEGILDSNKWIKDQLMNKD